MLRGFSAAHRAAINGLGVFSAAAGAAAASSVRTQWTTEHLERPYEPDPDSVRFRGDMTDGGRATMYEFMRRVGEAEGRQRFFAKYADRLIESGIDTLQKLKVASEQELYAHEVLVSDAQAIVREVRRTGAVIDETTLIEADKKRGLIPDNKSAITTSGMRLDLAIKARVQAVAERHYGVSMRWLEHRTPREIALLALSSASRWPIVWKSPFANGAKDPEYFHVPGTKLDWENLFRGGIAFPEDEHKEAAVVPAAWWYNDDSVRQSVEEELSTYGIPMHSIAPDPAFIATKVAVDNMERRNYWSQHVAGLLAARFHLTCESAGVPKEKRASQYISLSVLYPGTGLQLMRVLDQYEVCLSDGVHVVERQAPEAPEQLWMGHVENARAVNYMKASESAVGDGTGPHALIIAARKRCEKPPSGTAAKDVDGALITGEAEVTFEPVTLAIRCHLDVDRESVVNSTKVWTAWYSPVASESADTAGPMDAVLVCEDNADDTRDYGNRLTKNPLHRQMSLDGRFSYFLGRDIMTRPMREACFTPPVYIPELRGINVGGAAERGLPTSGNYTRPDFSGIQHGMQR